MKPVEPFSINGRLKSAQYALAGIVELLANQHNAWLHTFATTAVIALGLFLSLAAWEWCCLILAMTLVWVAEALNTALELLCDAMEMLAAQQDNNVDVDVDVSFGLEFTLGLELGLCLGFSPRAQWVKHM